MKCRFCQKEARYVPISRRTRTLFIYFCDDCQAEYVFFEPGENAPLFSYNLYTVINDQTYRWSVYPGGSGDDKPLGTLSSIGEPGIPGERYNRRVRRVTSFEDFPEMTPQNVEQKIRIILTFL